MTNATNNLSAAEAAVLERLKDKLGASQMAGGSKDRVDFMVHVTAQVSRDHDGLVAPTARALSLDAVAFILLRAGFQREAAVAALLEATQDDRVASLAAEDARVRDVRDDLKVAMAGLPKIPRDGSVRIKELAVTVVERAGQPVVLGAEPQTSPAAPATVSNQEARWAGERITTMQTMTSSSDPSIQIPVIQDLTGLVDLQAKAGGPHVGDMVWWTLADADVERQALVLAWQTAGLDPDLLPEVPTPEKALRAAVRAAQTGLRDQLVRLSYEGPDALVFVVKQEAKTLDHDTDYATLAKITLDRTNGQLTVTGQADVTSKIQVEFTRLLATHTARDVMTTIVKSLRKWAAVSLRETGGIYWVPTTQKAKLLALQQAVQTIGKSQVYLVPVFGSPEASRSIGAAAAGTIEADLAALKAEIDGFLEEAPRASTLTRRLDAFEDLRARADLYRTILGVTVDDLDARLADMTATVQTLLAAK